MSKLKIALTTGDSDGIGLEIAIKALNYLGPKKDIQILLYRSQATHKKKWPPLLKKWRSISVGTLSDALSIENFPLIEIESDLSPAEWVEEAAIACYNKKINALATGPMSKTSIKDAGFKDLGHTDILKRISKSKNVHMAFLGNSFNVILGTGHIPLRKVATSANFNAISAALNNANILRMKLNSKKPIAILGLNPHSGEEGLIGQEERKLFEKIDRFAKIQKIPVRGPIVPDSAFLKENWRKYFCYLALYHDQGLIPFKLVHGQDSGTHITLGIPFIRTSVDHGTAKDIFGLNRANPSSMIDAIEWAIKLARLSHT